MKLNVTLPLTIYSQQSACFWNRHNVAWPFLCEPLSGHTVLATAVCSVKELMWQDICMSATYTGPDKAQLMSSLRLRARRSGFRIPTVAREFFFSLASRQSLGPTLTPTQWVEWAVSPGVKRLESEFYHSPPSSAEIKNKWSYASTFPYFFMACKGTALLVCIIVCTTLLLLKFLSLKGKKGR